MDASEMENLGGDGLGGDGGGVLTNEDSNAMALPSQDTEMELIAGGGNEASGDQIMADAGNEDQPPQDAAPHAHDAPDTMEVDETQETLLQEGTLDKAQASEETQKESAESGDKLETPTAKEDPDTATEEKKTPKRKSISRPLKKVLVAKKERELGRALLKDKRDLAEILPIHDCMFLAKNYWIFTHEQLQSFLDTLGAEPTDTAEEGGEEKPSALEDFMSRLQYSGLLPSPAASSEKAGTEAQAAESSKPPPSEAAAAAEAAELSNSLDISPGDETAPAVLAQDLELTGGTVPEGSDVPVAMTREECEKRVQDWKEALATAASSSTRSMEDLFPVDGAISVLFSQATRNFLGSIPIRKLFDFLALKKTETGAICDMYAEWRNQCGLPKIPSLAAAKYLLGVNARIETAISVVPAVDPKTRSWMIDPIIVLTGAARDFLVVEQNILTATKFVETRTKDLAAALVLWREKNGLVPLKGSGKVAMVSGWKAAAKEAMEIDAAVGKVLPCIDLSGIPLLDADILSTLPSNAPAQVSAPASKRKSVSATPQKDSTTPDSEASQTVKSEPKVSPAPRVSSATRPLITKKSSAKTPVSSLYGKKQRPRSRKRATSASRQADYDLHSKLFLDETLGEEVTDLLSSANIHTAAQLFDADSKSGSKLSSCLLEVKLVEDEGESETLVSGWCKSLREGLDEIRRGGQPETKATHEAPPPSKKPKIEIKTPGSAAVRDASDPFDLLSAVTKKFLLSIGITTGEQFLSTRTTDMAAEFVQFRLREGMPELKGLGSIASVSGWKANCRKYAKSMGLDELAEVEPTDKSSWKPPPKSEDSPRKGKRSSTLASEAGFSGSQRRTVAVQSASDRSLQFKFDLSMRKSDVNPESDLYITYEGAAPKSPEPNTPVSEVRVVTGMDESETLSVLADAPPSRSGDRSIDVRVPFQTTRSGLVDIARYGIRPLIDQDLSSLKLKVKNFVLSGPTEDTSAGPFTNESNLVVNRTSIDKCQYLLYVAKPWEVGQAMPISFPSLESLIHCNRYAATDYEERHRILESLHLLSKADLGGLLGFLAGEVLLTTKFDDVVTQGNSREYADGDDIFKSQIAGQITAECRARQRLHWLNCRILGLMDQATLQPKEVRAKDSMIFGRHKLIKDPNVKVLPHRLSVTVKDAFKDELKEGVFSLIELDDLCGSESRQQWCSLFQDFFGGCVEDMSSYCVSSESTDELTDALATRLNHSKTICAGTDDLSGLVFSASPLHKQSEKKDVVIATLKDDDDAAVAVTPTEIQSGEAVLNSSWYRKNISMIASRLVYAFGACLDPSEYSAQEILSSLKDALSVDSDDICMSEFRAPGPLLIPSDPKEEFQPPSYQFFLGIVWPKLRDFGWRFTVNEFPSDVTYVAPRFKGDPKKKGKLLELAKRQRDRRRTETARTVGNLGLGPIPKLTKRLFLAGASFANETGDQSELNSNGPTGLSVEDVMNQFLDEVVSGIETSDEEGKVRAKKIVDSILDSFDELAPELQSDQDEHATDSPEEKPRVKFGVDVLMQFLLILPSILRHSELSLQQINDTQQVIQELTTFVTNKYKTLFPERMQPPVEHYSVKQKPTPNIVVTRLRHVRTEDAAGRQDGDELTELIWEEDKNDLTDFVISVMQQAVPCRATQNDTQKRHRRIFVGYPGAVCRHCMGSGGEGRYFFQTIDSLTTLGTVFEKHFAKCSSVPQEVKTLITSSKTRHQEQRRHLKSGSQQAYFVRLWQRLRSMKIAGDTAAGYVPNLLEGQSTPTSSPRLKSSPSLRSSADKNEDDADFGVQENKIELAGPIAVLDYIRTTPPWKGSREIEEALNQYYNCLDYGGRIYNTKVMPKHFSPAWLLAKVVPKQKKTKKVAPG